MRQVRPTFCNVGHLVLYILPCLILDVLWLSNIFFRVLYYLIPRRYLVSSLAVMCLAMLVLQNVNLDERYIDTQLYKLFLAVHDFTVYLQMT